MDGVAMALNIVFGGALGNITASQVLSIPDGQLKTDVRFPLIPFHTRHNNLVLSVPILMRPSNPSHPGTHSHLLKTQ
jgi:hypothetical protein